MGDWGALVNLPACMIWQLNRHPLSQRPPHHSAMNQQHAFSYLHTTHSWIMACSPPSSDTTTAAAMQRSSPSPHQQALLLQHQALPVLLSHPSVSGQWVLLAKLLMTCSQLSEAISQHLCCQISLSYAVCDDASVQHATGLADFISKRGHILQDCDICLSTALTTGMSHLLERSLALGFKAAAQSPRGLHLQAFELHGGTPSVAHILEQLPPHCLQQLHLCFAESDEACSVAPVAGPLGRLTGLTSLSLRHDTAEQLLPALSNLHRLQCLSLSTLSDVVHLAQLPPSLIDLQVSVKAVDEAEEMEEGMLFAPVNLAHLTQCTSLTGGAFPVPLSRAEDRLPPGLQELVVELCTDAAADALLPLTALTSLTMLEPQVTSKPRWEALAAALTNLRHLELQYCEQMGVLSSVHGWGGMPVKSLRVQMARTGIDFLLVPAATVSALTHLSNSLTHLSLAGVDRHLPCTVEATPRRLAGVLKQLTGLQQLVLSDLDFEDVTNEDVDDQHMDDNTLLEAIATLPHLSALSINLARDSLRSANDNKHPAMALTAAGTCLTHLDLSNYGLDDFAVTALVCALPELRVLDLAFNPAVQDTVLPVVAAQLPHLSSLALRCTGVSDSGLEFLSRLTGLKALSVPLRVSPAAIARALNWAGGVSVEEGGVVTPDGG